MKLTRKQKRWYFGRSEAGRRMQKLHFMHPDKVAHRRNNLATGKETHDEYVSAVQELLYEGLSAKEAAITERLKANNVEQSTIDRYMELWSDVVMWPKPDTYLASRKELKKLNKELSING